MKVRSYILERLGRRCLQSNLNSYVVIIAHSVSYRSLREHLPIYGNQSLHRHVSTASTSILKASVSASFARGSRVARVSIYYCAYFM